ncbi:hypothetical protein H4R34_000343 [Dimargaris verticillata]|uniref:MPN domain-containing protein n=1 Tax=Dimargaris verticillata TaxID=2761393 RepID=A0A9W8EFF8_9FUNG|nr:hypothetical protein H4R34_000343 [Dimargaris verticillata]
MMTNPDTTALEAPPTSLDTLPAAESDTGATTRSPKPLTPCKQPTKRKRGRQETAALSAQEEEAMSTALIAKLLQQDQDQFYGAPSARDATASYYTEYDHTGQYGGYKDDSMYAVNDNSDAEYSDDEEYNPAGKAKGRAKKAPGRPSQGSVARGRRRKNQGASPRSVPERTNHRENNSDTTTAADSPLTDGARIVPSGSAASASPKQAKRAKPLPTDTPYRTGAYLDEERQRFAEALELFGRDWKQVVAHVATRDEKSIRSHAQKHFIKLYRDNLPLPAKVQESGKGYTLSGLPLDPDSASARVYLYKRSQGPRGVNRPSPSTKSEPMVTPELAKDPVVTPLTTASAPVPSPAPCTDTASPVMANQVPLDGLSEIQAPVHPSDQALASNPTDSVGPNDKALTKSEACTTPFNAADANRTATRHDRPAKLRIQKRTPYSDEMKSPPRKLAKEPTKSHASSPKPTVSLQRNAFIPPSERTDYAKNRPRRDRAARSLALADDTDPLSLVKCSAFAGAPNSDTKGCQPFDMQVCSNAFLGMDFHAHLMQSEIIGFLAGKWDPATKQLDIQYAFPCRALQSPGQNASVNVEMDPTSELEVRQQIRDYDLQVVGWYHSHPCFLPDPSLVDLENQCNYQTLFRNPNDMAEPFVGAIVGPYDPNLPGSVSVVNWFYIDAKRVQPLSHGSSTHGVDFAALPDPSTVAKKLTFTYYEDASLPGWQTNLLLQLLARYQHEPLRTPLHETWKRGSAETALDKMLTSLVFRMSWLRTLNDAASSKATTAPSQDDKEGRTSIALADDHINGSTLGQAVIPTNTDVTGPRRPTDLLLAAASPAASVAEPSTPALANQPSEAVSTGNLMTKAGQALPLSSDPASSASVVSPGCADVAATLANPFTFKLTLSHAALGHDSLLGGILEASAAWE